jgi:hypothetical protein
LDKNLSKHKTHSIGSSASQPKPTPSHAIHFCINLHRRHSFVNVNIEINIPVGFLGNSSDIFLSSLNASKLLPRLHGRQNSTQKERKNSELNYLIYFLYFLNRNLDNDEFNALLVIFRFVRLLYFRAKNGQMVNFDISPEGTSRFGEVFTFGVRANTPRGAATGRNNTSIYALVIGVADNYLWFHIDGDKGIGGFADCHRGKLLGQHKII